MYCVSLVLLFGVCIRETPPSDTRDTSTCSVSAGLFGVALLHNKPHFDISMCNEDNKLN